MADIGRIRGSSRPNLSLGRSRPRDHDALLFINHTPGQRPGTAHGPSNLAGHARRWRTDKKHREQRDEASRSADYARSLVGWRRSSPPSQEDRDLIEVTDLADNEEVAEPPWQQTSQALQLSLNISGGLRRDPFDALPSTSNSNSVMHMVDYFIYTWAPQKVGWFDYSMGCNVNVAICWPYTLKDNMLFDATMAVARSAYCLNISIDPATDEFMLYHRGAALTRLRQRVNDRVATTEEVVFTIARMLSIAYMCNDYEAWDIHYTAFAEAAGRYLRTTPENDLTKVVANRIRSWKELHEFRTCYDPLQDGVDSLLEPALRESEPQADIQVYDFGLPHSLRHLADFNRASHQLMEIASTLHRLLSTNDGQANNLQNWVATGSFTTHGARLMTLLIQQDLSDDQFLLCCGLLAICLQLHHHSALKARRAGADTPGSSQAPRTSEPLRKLARGFINKKFKPSSEARKSLFTWASLALGSALLLHYDDLRNHGHIILINLATTVADPGAEYEMPHTANWSATEPFLTGHIQNELLFNQWKASWNHSMQVQQAWENHGLLRIGAPRRPNGQGVDIIEYMILRAARDSLPTIRPVLLTQ